MEVYHSSVSTSDTPRPIRKYESINVPPIRLILDAILAHCGLGGTFAPGVRMLAEWSGVSRGLVTDCLRQLAEEGEILYDGRNITLLCDPDQDEPSDRSADRSHCDEAEEVIDQLIDQPEMGDRSADRSLSPSPLLAAIQRTQRRWNDSVESDRSADRSAQLDSKTPHTPPMVHDSRTTTGLVVVDSVSTNGGSGGGVATDRSPDRSHMAAQIMAELGADPRVIADALAARQDWSPQQVRDRWDYDQRRIAASDGRLSEGVFYHALRCGQLAPQRPGHELDPESYVGDSAFVLGGHAPPPDAPESIRDHAARLLEAPTAETHSAYIRDWMFVQGRLGQGDSDQEALSALDAYRKAVRR